MNSWNDMCSQNGNTAMTVGVQMCNRAELLKNENKNIIEINSVPHVKAGLDNEEMGMTI
jgi:hypothetical protein